MGSLAPSFVVVIGFYFGVLLGNVGNYASSIKLVKQFFIRKILNRPKLSSVTGLNFPCCPSNISSFIISIYIYSIKWIRRIWPFTYMGKEFFKSIFFVPLITNSYSAIKICSFYCNICFFARASSPHSKPCVIFWSAWSSMFYRYCSRFNLLSMQASATFVYASR